MSEVEIDDDQDERVRADRHIVEIAGADLKFRKVRISDPVPNGLQIAQAFGGGNPNGLVVLQQLPNGELEELRLSETTDIRKRGIERFIVAEADRTYRFVVEGLGLVWFFSDPTALTIKTLLGKGEEHVVVQKLENDADREFQDDERVNLEGRDTEEFYFRKVKRQVTVKYNHTPFTLDARVYKTEELLVIFSVPDGYVLARIAKDGEFVELKPGETIRLVECMEFVSHAPCGGAS